MVSVDVKHQVYLIYLRRTHERQTVLKWQDHRQSDEHWNRFKGNVGETSERWGGAHMGLSEHIDTILNWTELN